MKPGDIIFDRLWEWEALSASDLQQCFNLNTEAQLRYIVERLGGPEEKRIQIGQESFGELLAALCTRYRLGSRALGVAIIEAEDAALNGDHASALRILQTFIESCPSECYREVGEDRVRKMLADR